MRMIDLIIKKRDRKKLNFEELSYITEGASKGYIPDYQLSAWLMSVYFNGLDYNEMAYFTKAMANSGSRLDLSSIRGFKVDKHSTGGVGDGVSLALAPIVASAGVIVPMMSGRGLGHTGGTLDKLESIKGFNVRLSSNHIIRQLKAINLCMFGQTGELAPADKKLYALRDVTGTVESIPLIVASILSKKYAEGINGLVMDVKFGNGAFMQDYKKAKILAVNLIRTAKLLGINSVAFLTDMNNPLGRAIGNGIEMEQSIRMLQGEKITSDFEELVYSLSGYMIYMAKKAKSYNEGIDKAIELVRKGNALATMKEMIKWQNGDIRVITNPSTFIPRSKFVCEVKSPCDGYIKSMHARTIGYASIAINVGRTKAEDKVDFGAGFYLDKKVGDYVKKGDIIAHIYASDSSKINEAKKLFISAISFSKFQFKAANVIKEIIK